MTQTGERKMPMIDRILTKKNLIILGIIAVVMRAAAGVLPWFLPFTSLMLELFDIPLYLLIACTIVYVGKQNTPVRFQTAQMLLILFFVWTILGCLSMSVAYNNDWVHYNADPLYNVFFSCMVFFPLGYVLIREKPAAVGKGILHFCLLAWTAFILVVLIVVSQGKTLDLSEWKNIDGAQGQICFYKNSLILNCNRNHTGAWEMVFFLLCCFMVLGCRHPAWKAVYGVAAAIHYVALILSNSRASVYSAMAGWIVMAGIGAYLSLKKQKERNRILIAIAAAAAAGLVFYLLNGVVHQLFTTKGRGLAGTVTNTMTGTAAKAKTDITSGRVKIWKASLNGIFSSVRSFFFGFTTNTVPDMIGQFGTNPNNVSYTHNEFLEIAAGYGVPALCIFLVWLFFIVRDAFRLFFVQKNKTCLLGIPVIIFVLLLANMFEAHLIFLNHFSGYVFFFLCGILHGAANAPMPGGHPRLKAFFAAFRETKK